MSRSQNPEEYRVRYSETEEYVVAVILMRAAMAEASAKIAVMRTAILKIWKIRGCIIATA